jgi:hypothetical protein
MDGGQSVVAVLAFGEAVSIEVQWPSDPLPTQQNLPVGDPLNVGSLHDHDRKSDAERARVKSNSDGTGLPIL